VLYVHQQNDKSGLTLCAVIPGWRFINVALKQPAWQSSTWGGDNLGLRVAGMSVDGNKDPIFSDLSCSATNSGDLHPWWAVDLGEPTYIYGVNFTNRLDSGMHM
jgi:hypothetical protein